MPKATLRDRDVGWIARLHRVPEGAVRIALTAPLPPIRFHDLRHGAASMLRAAKVEIKVISEILGTRARHSPTMCIPSSRRS